MSVIPSPYIVGVKRWAAGAVDEMGNPVDGWAEDASPWKVRSVDPATSREPGAQFRDMATIAYIIQADKTADVPTYRDLVVIGGKDYPVDGAPDDWTQGPWVNPAAGVTVYLKRVEG